MKFLTLALTILIAAANCAFGLSRIELAQGGHIEGQILMEKPDGYVVDLGFTVITVPKDCVAGVKDASEAPRTEQRDEDLYKVIKNPANLSVKELAERYGQAVVIVRTSTGLGSGFVIHPDGYIITNDHVVAGEHAITVTIFAEGRNAMKKINFENVSIVATSSEWDLALLKIEDLKDQPLIFAPLGDSDYLRRGQPVFAVGSPMGLERTVSQGIVSVKNRLIDGRLFIQTTAQISPGNSGGPLFNLNGEVVGVNNMKVVAEGAEGLGFAIPANMLKIFLKNRDAFAFDPLNPNSGFRYNQPPRQAKTK